MKIRHWFVSNSSSSSFVCDVCGREDGGYDVGLRDVEMVLCENGHTICNWHIINKDEPFEYEYNGNIIHVNNFNELGDKYEFPEKYCPVCQLQDISAVERNKYLLKITGKTETEIDDDIKKFGSYIKFKEFLEG